MCSCGITILQHLSQVAVQLYAYKKKNSDILLGLCEKDLAAIIHQYYQEEESVEQVNGNEDMDMDKPNKVLSNSDIVTNNIKECENVAFEKVTNIADKMEEESETIENSSSLNDNKEEGEDLINSISTAQKSDTKDKNKEKTVYLDIRGNHDNLNVDDMHHQNNLHIPNSAKVSVFQSTFSENDKIDSKIIPKYSCDICGKIWKCIRTLKEHKTVHTGERSFPCDLCGKFYKTFSMLNRHKKTHLYRTKGEKPFRCDVCEKSFATKTTLKQHFLLHTGEKPFSCDVCGESYAARNSLRFHKQIHTGERSCYKCTICDETFVKKPDFMVHKKSHALYSDSFNNDTQNLSSNSEIKNNELLDPILIAGYSEEQAPIPISDYSEEAEPIPIADVSADPEDIPITDVSADSEPIPTADFSAEEPEHIPIDDDPEVKEEIKEEAESGEDEYFEEGVEMQNYEDDSNDSNDITAFKFKCDICGKRSRTNWHLLRHKKTHTGERPFSCKVCGKSFIQHTTLTGHMRVHTGEKNYSCDICGKYYTSKGVLNRHMIIHKGFKLRPHFCDVCGKKYSSIENLKDHKRIHTGERPYSCDVCGKSYTGRNALSYHKKVHTGEKPFPCEICQKSFLQNSDLIKHKRTHEKELPKFVDCSDILKPEIKEEVKESYDPLSVDHSVIKAEIKQEEV